MIRFSLFIVVILLTQLATADTFTLSVVPSSSRVDGSPLKLSELKNCKVWDVSDSKNKKLVSSDMLKSNYEYNALTAGTYKFTADCTDTDDQTSDPSPVVTRVVAVTALANPEVPKLTSKVSGKKITFTLTPPTKRVDGSPLKKADIEYCKIFDRGVSQFKLVTNKALNNPESVYSVDSAGKYTFSATCKDTQGNSSGHTAIMTIMIEDTAPAAPAAPTLNL